MTAQAIGQRKETGLRSQPVESMPGPRPGSWAGLGAEAEAETGAGTSSNPGLGSGVLSSFGLSLGLEQ